MVYCAKCGRELPENSAFCPSCGAPVQQPIGLGPASVSGMDRVINESRAQGYWFRRLIAFIIDAFIVDVVLLIVALVLAIPALLIGGFAAVGSLFAGMFSIVSGVVLVFYFAVIEAASGTSIGKFFLGLKVTTVGDKRPDFGETIVRNISKVYWILLLLDVVVGLATSKQYSQKFSDRMVGTEVVSSSSPSGS